MRIYIDTHVAAWVARSANRHLSRPAQSAIRRSQIIVSPAVLLELELLFEIGRIKLPARDVLRKLGEEINLEMSALPFSTIAEAAVDEKWTRDPFDRLIVANARVDGLALLVTADGLMRAHYGSALW